MSATSGNSSRPVVSVGGDFFYPPRSIDPSYTPKVGSFPFEIAQSGFHPGSEIINVHDTGAMASDDVLDLVRGIDDRALANMPQEVLDEIKSDNISHVFQTDPQSAGAFDMLDESVKKEIVDQKRGSIYFRTKEGRTARWKLPEIAGDDAGWDANKGLGTFMDNAIYGTQDEIYSINSAETLRKRVNKGKISSKNVDPSILGVNTLDEINAGKAVTGVGDAIDITALPAPQAVTQPSKTTSSGGTKGSNAQDVGRPAQIKTTADPATASTIDNTSSAPTGGSKPRTFESGTAAATARVSVDDNGASRASTNAGRASTGAPSGRSTAALRNSSDNISGGVAKGMSNSKNLKMLGAASLIGIGGLALRGRQNARDDYERRLQMQREGIITRS